MPKLIAPDEAKRLRDFFSQVGYTKERMKEMVGGADLSPERLHSSARLLDLTREPSCLNLLLRWFWLGVPQDVSCAQLLPSWFMATAVDSGLLQQNDAQLHPQVMFVEVEKFLIASDPVMNLKSDDPRLVLWPNPTTYLLLCFTIRRSSGLTLDLGTGTGLQALAAASHSQQVIATDANARAIEFAAFNARLNGIENLDLLTGDWLAPVRDRKFDLILCNPPFYINPSGRYLYSDSFMELDQLCQRLVRDVPGHLEDGGYFQVICEWAQVSGQSWQERLKQWLDASGCDAWVMMMYGKDPQEYAEERVRQARESPERETDLYHQYTDYYRRHGVQAIHGGVIAMRRRSGHNWVHFEEAARRPLEPFGDIVLRSFRARDFLEAHSSETQLLDVKPKLSPDTRLEHVFQPGHNGWQVRSLNLKLTRGSPFSLSLQPLVAEFLGACNGTRTLLELIQELSTRANAPSEQVKKECLGVARRLIERGFLLC